MSDPRTFKSRVDLVPAIALGLLALSVPASLAGAVATWSSSAGGAIVWLASAAFCAGLLLLVAWPVRYVLEQRELVIRFGALSARIPYANITDVQPTRSLLAAPALSRDRLQIVHTHGEAMVSPLDKDGFLRELAARRA
jgi:hypothetical protein